MVALFLKSEALNVPITFICHVDDFWLIGEGGWVSCYSVSNGACISRLSVIEDARVHGVSQRTRAPPAGATGAAESDCHQEEDIPSPQPHSLAVYGGRYLCLVSLDAEGRLQHQGVSAALDGWLLDVRWLQDGSLAALDAQGRLLRLSAQLEVTARLRCPDACLLYSGALLGAQWSHLVAFCGTVFAEVLVWPVADGATVQHRLQGHRGPVLALTADADGATLVSCSDDRSVRRWQASERGWRAAAHMFGHQARVWAALLLPDSRLVSVGEDSCVCVWTAAGALQRRWRAHQGGSVRAAVVCDGGRSLVTGGRDGGVTAWSLDCAAAPAPQPVSLPAGPADDFVRSVHELSGERQLVVTDAGRLLLVAPPAAARAVLQDSRLASYALLAVAPDARHVTLAGQRGLLITLKHEEGCLSVIGEQQLWKDKVFSQFWLSEDTLVVCDGGGSLQLLHLDVGGCWRAARRHRLPACKQRWLSAAVLWGDRLVAADRDGGLHLFSAGQEVPVQSLRRLHGRHGATALTLDGERSAIWSLGRDGTRRCFQLEAGSQPRLQQVQCQRLPWDWPVQETTVDGTAVIVGFHSSALVVWSPAEDRELWRVRCGGGHRSWALSVSADRLGLNWVSRRELLHVVCLLSHLRTRSVKPGLHSAETHSAVVLGEAGDGGTLLATAGEDCTVRLVSARCGRPLRPLCTLRSHISAVRALCARAGYLVSAGGRAQLVLWRRTGDTCSQLSSLMVQHGKDAAETRFMALEMRCTEDSGLHFTVAAAGSDGLLRLFGFDSERLQLAALRQLPVAAHCLLQLAWLRDSLLVSDTAGVVWSCADSELSCRRLGAPHQSGVNALAVFEREGDARLLTAGDDGAVAVCRVESDGRLVEQARRPTAHASQVTGAAWLPGGLLVTTSVDQRVVLWEQRAGQLHQLACHLTAVADVKGLCCWTQDRCCLLLVYGEGLELLSMESGADSAAPSLQHA